MVWTQEKHTVIEKDHLGAWLESWEGVLLVTDFSTTLTLTMASAQVVTAFTNNSHSQDSNHPDDLFQSRYIN